MMIGIIGLLLGFVAFVNGEKQLVGLPPATPPFRRAGNFVNSIKSIHHYDRPIRRNHDNDLKFVIEEKLKNLVGINKVKSKPEPEPWFCHKLVCPKFKTLEKRVGYDVREYNEMTHWFGTELAGVDLDSAESVMFDRLFKYIEGNNTRTEIIKMTAPVLVKIIPGQGPTCKDDFDMYFFNDPKLTNPPTPTDNKVFFQHLPTMKVYVTSFSGYAKEKDWLEHAANLTDALVRDQVSFQTDFYYTAGYDSPFRPFFRHNEVIFLAKED